MTCALAATIKALQVLRQQEKLAASIILLPGRWGASDGELTTVGWA